MPCSSRKSADRIGKSGATGAQQASDDRWRQARPGQLQGQLLDPGRRRELRRKLIVVEYRLLINAKRKQKDGRDDASTILSRRTVDDGGETVFTGEVAEDCADIGRAVEHDLDVPVAEVAFAVGKGGRATGALTPHERDVHDA